MDVAQFGLKHPPFRNVLDPSLYFPTVGHDAALKELADGLTDQESLCLLDGAAGLGKTLLAHRLIATQGDGLRIAFLSNAHFPDRVDLLRAVLFDLGDAPETDREGDLRLLFTQQVLDSYRDGVRTLVLIDEAHLLQPELLEEVRMWGNLEGPQGPAVQVILLAQPSIRDVLGHDGLAGFRLRLGVRHSLVPFTPDESAGYLRHQLERAGGKPDKILTTEALELLVEKAEGVPRLLNQLANRAFRLTVQGGEKTVDVEAVLEAVRVTWE